MICRTLCIYLATILLLWAFPLKIYTQILDSDEKLVYAELIAIPMTDDIYLSWEELLLLQRGQNLEYAEIKSDVYTKSNFSKEQLTELAQYLEKLEPIDATEINRGGEYVEMLLFLYSSSGKCYILKSKTCDTRISLNKNTVFKMKTKEYDFKEFFVRYLEDWKYNCLFGKE